MFSEGFKLRCYVAAKQLCCKSEMHNLMQ